MFFSPAGSWEELLPLELIDRPNFHFLLENVLNESDGIHLKSNNSELMILSSAQNRAVEQFKDIIEEDSSLNLEVLVQKV